MPEYLAPGVYVEERDSGAKAIEGVSTTTSGMVGITERGPEGVPTLVIGFADFSRQFGGLLDRRVYTGANWYLPHAVDGFFTNGGQRLYVVRVLPTGATASETMLFDRGASGGANTMIGAPVSAGDTSLFVAGTTGVNAGEWLKIDDEEGTEYVQVKSTAPTQFTMRGGVRFKHDKGAKATTGTITAGAAGSLAAAANPNDLSITIAAGLTPADGDILEIGAGATREYAVIDDASATPVLALTYKLTNPHGIGDPVTVVTITNPTTTTLTDAVAVAGTVFSVEDGKDFGANDVVELEGATNETEYRLIDPVLFLGIGTPAADTHAAGSPVKAGTVLGASNKLAADTVSGSKDIVLTSAVAANDILQLGSGNAREIVVVASVDTPLGTTATLQAAPQSVHANGTDVAVIAPGAFLGAATLATALNPGDTILPLTGIADLTGYDVDDVLEIGGATTEYRLVTSQPTSVTFAPPLQSLHAANTALVERAPLITVAAIDRGGWGNDLYLVAEDDDPVLDTFVNEDADPGDFALEMRTTVGVEVGSVLEIAYDVPANAELHKVAIVTSKGVKLTTPLAKAAGKGLKVRTREFRLSVQLRQLNPATSKLRVIESEAHRHLSMDPRHTRYFAKVIGHLFRDAVQTPLQADGRTQGESDLIRVEDVLLDANGNLPPTAESTIRLGPDLITDTLPDGRVVAVASRLSGGGDSIATVTDDTYVGSALDNLDPLARRGIFALKNIDEISIVAIPGRTTQKVQQALIDHCELLRYRFAVLDAGPNEKIAEVQEHRSLFDTKYGALYHPWLLIEDPFPDNPRVASQVAIPPSGHVIGIYARNDIERGVHKAPANEVVRGISDLTASLAKQHQDILNPLGINVIRNFRPDGRGLRVWGARTLSSDRDWQYVNIRRLFIFLEASIDRATQWVVFEPNSELLWQRVNRVISGFLLAVWRDGALMGLKPEEAFFVKCDRTTMTQNDIDNGRLIVLIGVAPVKPAEFVIFRIGQFTASKAE